MKPQTGSQSVDRASNLLVLVLGSPEAISFGHLVSATQLPKSTVSRLLGSLERQGLVQRTVDGAVRPGVAITRFAHSAGAVDSLIDLAHPYLTRIARATGETINLAVPGVTGVEQIDQVDSTYLLGAVNWVGRGVPFHCSALGKVFLAYGAAELPAGRLERRTSQTVTNRATLDLELLHIGKLGYAVADSELEPGLVAIAAPVHGASGEVIAAISVTGPALRLTPVRFATVGALLVETCMELSAGLGYLAEANNRSARPGRARRAGAA